MDDVRIFTNSVEDARRALFTMIRTLRMLHLNVQTAKTRILDEKEGAVTKALIDSRSEDIAEIQDEIRRNYGEKEVPVPDRTRYLRELWAIAKRKSHSDKGQPILHSRRPLEGLSSRVFRRWTTAHLRLRSDKYVHRLLTEIERNPDDKIGGKLIPTVKAFPNRRGIERRLLDFVKSPKCIFPYQEAQCLRAMRYLSNPSDALTRHCVRRAVSVKADPYVKVQAALLLTRMRLTNGPILRLWARMQKEPNEFVRCAVAAALTQRRPNASFVRYLVSHPNEPLRALGVLLQGLMSDVSVARRELDFALSADVPWRVCDRMPFIHIMAAAEVLAVKRLLLDRLTSKRSLGSAHLVFGISSVASSVN